MKILTALISTTIAATTLTAIAARPHHTARNRHKVEPKDTLRVDKIEPTDQLKYAIGVDGDTIALELAPENRSGRLSEEDFVEVAAELDIEVAAIKAVVEIEAGKSHQGFWSEGKPLINFDLTMFRRFAARNGVALGKYRRSHSVVFSRPNAVRYGSQQAAQQARLDAARTIHDLSAIQGTFWGMFQIGGFNWKKCGTNSIDEFVRLMSRSERDQLELFATFVRNSGLLPALRARNWSSFARGYNGPSYAARGYHTRMAAAYSRFKRMAATVSDTDKATDSDTPSKK